MKIIELLDGSTWDMETLKAKRVTVAKKGFASTPHWVSLCDLRAFAVNSDLR